MKAKEFAGIIPPVLTAFTQRGEIYEKGIREIVSFVLPHVDGLYPVGTYGCGPMMTVPERKRALEIVLDEVDGKVPVVAHVGAADTVTTVELANHAKKAGASGVGAICPYYSPHLPEDCLFAHYASLIDAVGEEQFPVFLYNNPHYSQNPVTPGLLARLADYGLRGCKDSSFDFVNFLLYQNAVSAYSDFNLIIGTEAIFVGAFEAGATGCVCGMGNIYPELMAKMLDQFQRGDKAGAMQSQRLILSLRQITKRWPTVAVMHSILKMRGVDAGHPRRPYADIDEASQKIVKSELGKLGLI